MLSSTVKNVYNEHQILKNYGYNEHICKDRSSAEFDITVYTVYTVKIIATKRNI